MAKQQQSTSQFMHIELYSRAGNVTTKKTSIAGVINEAVRVEGFTSHIIADGFTPSQPTYLFSQENKTLEEHYSDLMTQVENEKDSLGRKIKSDKNILLAGVVSYPKPRVAEWTDEDKENYFYFKELTLEFLKEKWGDNLVCVLEHTDEQYPHLHFYVVNKNKVANTPELHPGFNERIKIEKEAKANKIAVDKKLQVKKFNEAMKKFQDEYYQKVSMFIGLDRLGPKVQRMNRTEWRERKRAAKLLAKAFKKVKEQATDMNAKSTELNKSMVELEQQIASVLNLQTELEAEQKEIDKEKEKIQTERKAMAVGLDNLELAKFVRENYKEIVTKYNIEKMRKNKPDGNNKILRQN